MADRTLKNDRTIRHGDITVDVTDGTVTITAGRTEDHEHLELTADQAIRLYDGLSDVMSWDD
jgi:hypothetical protein